MEIMKKNIGDKYDLICSPFELVEADKSVDIVSVKNITMEDVERILKYDK